MDYSDDDCGRDAPLPDGFHWRDAGLAAGPKPAAGVGPPCPSAASTGPSGSTLAGSAGEAALSALSERLAALECERGEDRQLLNHFGTELQGVKTVCDNLADVSGGLAATTEKLGTDFVAQAAGFSQLQASNEFMVASFNDMTAQLKQLFARGVAGAAEAAVDASL